MLILATCLDVKSGPYFELENMSCLLQVLFNAVFYRTQLQLASYSLNSLKFPNEQASVSTDFVMSWAVFFKS